MSAACVAATVALLIRRLPPAPAVLALLLLVASRSFVEFSTSGLENPLSHLLLVIFWLEAMADSDGTIRRPTRFCVVAALCCLNRLDLALLIAPRMLAWLWQRPPRALRSIAWGALPLIAWFAFALVYYGSLTPNTVLAKLGTGIPLRLLAWQGLYYLLESLLHDPVTLPTIAAVIVWAIVKPSLNAVSLPIGLALHLLFIVRVGGDFMSGRFLSAPFVCAVLFVASRTERWLEVRPLVFSAVALVVIGTSLTAAQSPLRLWTHLPVEDESFEAFHGGILSERLIYAGNTGLAEALLLGQHPSKRPWSRVGTEHHGLPNAFDGVGAVGLLGYHAGPATHIIDPLALTDPLLARLPSASPDNWRIGHFQRAVPPGYEESLAECMRRLFPHGSVSPPTHSCLDWPAETNRIADPALARQYDTIRLVTQAPLFSAQRLRAIVRLNLGW